MNTQKYRVLTFVVTVLTHHVISQYDGRSHKDCREKADVVFLLDGSDSISDAEFKKEKEIVINVIRDSSIGADSIRVGALVFSSDLGDSVDLSNLGSNDVSNAVWSLTQPQDGSRLDLGINQVERMFYQNGRKDVRHIGVIITDGRSKYPDASQGESEAIRNIGIMIVTVGVGRLIDDAAMMNLATKPEMYVPNEPVLDIVQRLVKIIRSLSTDWCAGLTYPPTTSTTTTTTTPAPTTTRTTTTTRTQRPLPLFTARHSYQEYQKTNPPYQIHNNNHHIATSSLSNKAPAPIDVQTDTLPSTGHWMKSNPAEKPWWETQAGNELGWGGNRGSWKQNQITRTPETKYQTNTKSSWYSVTDKPWEGIYRNPVQSIKLFDIKIPIQIPHIIRGSRGRPQPAETRPPLPTTTTVTTSTQSTTPPLPPPADSQFMKPSVAGQISSNGQTTQVYIASEKSQSNNIHEHDHSTTDVKKLISGTVGVCFGSQFVDGVGYNSDSKSCNEFIQCFYDNGKIRAENARCPFRMFWDQRLLLCRPSESMQCWRDPCFDFNMRAYDHKGNCRAHWSCENGLSTARCCPLGFAFREGKGCVRDPTCKDWCEDSGELTFSAPFASCRMTPFETNEKFYFEEIPGLGMMTRSCPRGSKFNAGLCTCEISDDVRKKTCRPELILDFAEGFHDKSGNNLAITPQNVHVENGAAKFEGNGKLTIWRFSSFSFGSQITITMKYKENPHSMRRDRQHLISNCCCMDRPGPSLDISVHPDKHVTFTASTDKHGEALTTVQTRGNEWKTAAYIYDGSKLTGMVDGVNSSISLRGMIEERPAALVLGSCDFFGGFDGYIDDVRLYLCVPGSVS